MKGVIGSCLLAGGFWFFMFSPWTAGIVNFWAALTIAASLLSVIALRSQRRCLRALFAFKRSDIFVGIASAAFLYGIFYAGYYVIAKVMTFGALQVSRIYDIRSGMDSVLVGLLLFTVIGPAEAVFWQGLVQHRLSFRYGKAVGFGLTCFVYSMLHLWAFNPSLLLAALVCGLFWGGMFWRIGRLWPVIISHAAWDLVIFVIRPIQ